MPVIEFKNLPDKTTPISAEILNEMQDRLLELVFPVGQPYFTQSSTTNPSSILGFGTWELIEGRVLVGGSTTDRDFTVGTEGGVKEHRHGQNHQFNSSVTTSNGLAYTDGGTIPNTSVTTSASTTLQPYFVSGYMWVRVA